MGTAPVEAPPEKPPRTCLIEQALPVSVIQLIQAAPHNETVRAVVLAHLKQPVPKEAATFEQIKEWIETTIVKAPPKGTVTATGAPAPRAHPTNVLEVEISGSEDEFGTCRYSVRNTGCGTVPIPFSELEEMMAESDDLDEFRSRVSDYISNEWMDHVSTSSDDDGYEHEQYEATSTENNDWDYDSNIAALLRQFVQEHGDEDTRERLS